MMMNKISIFLLLFILLLSGCAQPNYLPSPSSIDVNHNGSYIKLRMVSGSFIRGELIAIDSSNILILTKKNPRIVKLPFSKIESFRMRYAKSTFYGLSIPIISVLSIYMHGIFSVVMLPINLLTTIIVTVTGHNDYVYKKKHISNEQLRMYARFPQGIPKEVELYSIK